MGLIKNFPTEIVLYMHYFNADAKLRSSPLKCTICEVTLRPESLPSHYQQELDKLEHLQPCSTHRRREPHPSASSVMAEEGAEREEGVLAEAKKVSCDLQKIDAHTNVLFLFKTLESVQRKRFLFEHKSHDQPGPTSQSHDSRDILCPVCSIRLPSDDGSRVAHIDGCLREQQASLAEGGAAAADLSSDSESETYEEYTWCNTTRIRTTSLLTPQTRASETILFQ